MAELPSGTVTILRALAAVDEAVAIARHLGGFLLVNCLWAQAWCRGSTGDWAGALRGCVESHDAQRRFHTPLAGGSLTSAACALVALGHPEPATIIVGFASTRFDGFSAAHADLATKLDDEDLAALTARGTTLSPDVAVAYLRAEAERVLADQAPP